MDRSKEQEEMYMKNIKRSRKKVSTNLMGGVICRYLIGMAVVLLVSFVCFNWDLVSETFGVIGKQLAALGDFDLWRMPLLLVAIATLGVIIWTVAYNRTKSVVQARARAQAKAKQEKAQKELQAAQRAQEEANKETAEIGAHKK